MKPILHSREPLERPAPDDFTRLVEARDFLRVNLPQLTTKERVAVEQWARGRTCAELAAGEGVTPRAIQQRLQSGLRRLRELAGEAPEKNHSQNFADPRTPLLGQMETHHVTQGAGID